ncbi:MAG TPA: protoporphyrinogen oxidase [Stackebrandtia sp.]|jgi:oxygen-dependent protoporphyrinogen oxidase|uniref:protoporphyrinogen oxidase n=1 Tax=Stackebrandtia sp. TaxID=2023065 RepID=UPI002D250140|nr:protoporphyrinogen oxidase [Stackebrandtia sp.]HZE39227.1 protoporphyrinogen oxidase [Stackebrandtia sp.]
MSPRDVLVIGGGIAGVSAAARLRELGGDRVRVTLVEQTRRLGGKIHTGQIAGVSVETGAETFLVRRDEGVDLATAVGLGERLVHPAGLPAAVAIDGSLRDLPRGTVMGIPADAAGVETLIPAADAERIRDEPSDLDLRGEDIAVGRLVRQRFGDAVVDRLVDPLLGGVYAGRADDLSLDVTVPQLAAALRRHTRLGDAVADCLPPPPSGPAKPVFGSIDTGLSTLVESVAAHAGADILYGLPVRELARTPSGWRAVIGATRDPRELTADAVVLAVPARPAARLLADTSAAASAEVGVLDYASVALVTLALPGVDLPQRSGFLVPATEGLTIKAATFFTRKWPHLDAGGLTVVRASLGRYGEEAVLQRDDAELAAAARADLSTLLGTDLPAPIDVAVKRWGGGLPQYGPGHADRVRRARAALADHPIALAGAGFDGVGIPACIASGRAAAESVLQMVENPDHV